MIIKQIIKDRELVFETRAGLFSKDHVDPGSILLIENVEIKDGDVIEDLGCGYGAIGLPLAIHTPSGIVFMVDTDIRAVELSKINAELNKINNISVMASDGFKNLPKDLKCNLVVANPPSHTPKEIIIEFVEGAERHLNMGGKLYFVTENRIVPMIRKEFERIFGNYERVIGKHQYTLSATYKQTE